MNEGLCKIEVDQQLRPLRYNKAARDLSSALDIHISGLLAHLLSAGALSSLRTRLGDAGFVAGQLQTLELERAPAGEGLVTTGLPVLLKRTEQVLPSQPCEATAGRPCLANDPGQQTWKSLQTSSDSQRRALLAFRASDLLWYGADDWASLCKAAVQLGSEHVILDERGRPLGAGFRGANSTQPLPHALASLVDELTLRRLETLMRQGATGVPSRVQLKHVVWTIGGRREVGQLAFFPGMRQGVAVSYLLVFQSQPVSAAAPAIASQSLATAVESDQSGTAIITPSGHIEYVNRAQCIMMGYDEPDEVLGSHWRDHYEAATSVFIERAVFPLLERDAHWEGELVGLRRDGSSYQQSLALTVVRGGGLVASCRDITATRRMEAALEVSEGQFRAIFELAHDAMITFDRQGIIAHWNRAAEQQLGIAQRDAVGCSIDSILAPLPASERQRWESLRMPSTEGGSQVMKSFLLNSGGNPVNLEVAASSWRRADAARLTTWVIRDITDRLEQERKLEAAAKRLARLQARRESYSDVVDYASAILKIGAREIERVLELFVAKAGVNSCSLWRLSGGGKVESCASAGPGERNLSQPPSPASLTALEPYRATLCRCQDLPMNEGDCARGGRVLFDFLEVVGSGRNYLLWTEIDRLGSKEKLLALFNLTSLKLTACLESEARVLVEARRTALEDIGQVAACLAHDANNFASIIRDNAGLLREEVGFSGEGSDLLDDIEQAVSYHQELIGSLLGATRLDHYQTEMVAADLVVHRIAKLFRNSLAPDITLSVETHSDPWRVPTDPSMLGTALLNVLVNAQHACTSGGRIGLSSRHRDGRVEIAVSDNGVGIPPENIDRVTEPFYSERGGAGTGLGLYMVKRFCDQTGGLLRIKSRPGEGTQVLMQLPAFSAAEPAQVASPRLGQPLDER